MPTPQQGRPRIPIYGTEMTSTQILQNFRAVQQWATKDIPIFPVYQISEFDGPVGEIQQIDSNVLEYPAMNQIQLTVEKQFDWTLLVCEVSLTAYVETLVGRVNFNAVLNRQPLAPLNVVAPFYFDTLGHHCTVHGLGMGLEAPAGEHVVSLYVSLENLTMELKMNEHDKVTFRVQEQAPILGSGERW